VTPTKLLIPVSAESHKNERLLLYLQLCNLRQCGGKDYRQLPEYRRVAMRLFVIVNRQRPRNDDWINSCPWLP
jgi:hypothetical protein